MRGIIITCAALLLLACPAISEELAPGYDECVKKSETLGQENVCTGQAAKYWGKKLDERYAKMRKACGQATNPGECRDRLKKMQLGWLNYTSGIDKMIREGLYVKKEITTTNDIDIALSFELQATKEQYEILGVVESTRDN